MISDNNINSPFIYNLECIDKLHKICKPISSAFNLSLFTYRRLYHDGNLLHLCTNEKWLHHCYNNRLWVSQAFNKKINTLTLGKSKNFLWSGDMNDPLYNNLYEFNIWNGITFYERHQGFTEVYAFSTDKNHGNASIWYLSHLEYLKKFILYFNDKANDIIFNSTKDILLPLPNLDIIFQSCENKFDQRFKCYKDCEKFYLSGNYRKIYLTKREIELVYELVKGISFKEIAVILGISPRTIEAHVNNLKRKLCCSCKSEIINIVRNRL